MFLSMKSVDKINAHANQSKPIELLNNIKEIRDQEVILIVKIAEA